MRKTKISHLGTKIICYFYALFAFNLAAAAAAAAAILPCTYILRSFFKMGAKNASLFCLFVLNYVQNMCIMVIWVVEFPTEGYKIR